MRTIDLSPASTAASRAAQFRKMIEAAAKDEDCTVEEVASLLLEYNRARATMIVHDTWHKYCADAGLPGSHVAIDLFKGA